MISIVTGQDPALIRDAMSVRYPVFVREQGFAAEDEEDGLDAGALHVVAYADGRAVACARLLVHTSPWHLGRVAVLAPFRGQGLGRAVCLALLRLALARGQDAVELTAQLHAVGFYEKLGFVPRGAIFDECGAPHRTMVLHFGASTLALLTSRDTSL